MHKKYTFAQAAKLLFSNKYYLLICATYMGTRLYASALNMGLYFMKFILGDEEYLGDSSLAINIPLVIGLLITPALVRKMGSMYKCIQGQHVKKKLPRANNVVGAG